VAHATPYSIDHFAPQLMHEDKLPNVLSPPESTRLRGVLRQLQIRQEVSHRMKCPVAHEVPVKAEFPEPRCGILA
jgi:hypothetical protein